jgi:plastocyanin
MPRIKRLGFPAGAALAALAGLLLLSSPVGAATRTVHVGQGGSNFVDEVSGSSVSTIQVGDTINWVWEGTMQHSVTSGFCARGGGGGGYGGGGDVCTDAGRWPSSGLHGAGYTYSQTFSTQGTFSYYCAFHESAMQGSVVVQPAVTTGPCVTDANTLCLNSGRFKVTAHWTRPDGSQGEGTGVPLTADSGYFWFFDSTNIEAIVKVLNGCGLPNPSYWVFAAGLTNVAVHVTVTDTVTGVVYARDNAQGSAFVPIQDTAAFPTSCP